AAPVTYVTRAPGENCGVALIADETLKAISEIPYLRAYDDGIYRDLDIEATLLDCASGFGWLAFAYLLAGGKHAVLVELDRQRLDATHDIARLLGVEDRCSFLSDRIQDLPLSDDSVDIFASVETLE